jgi:hypothetical protein
MQQRRDERIQADQTVEITVFGPPDIRLPARIINVSGRGIGLEIEGPIAIGSALKIVLEDAILLGEVIYCRSQNEGWYLGIELEQALRGLGELAASLSAFSEPRSGPERPHTLQHTRQQDDQQAHQ